MTAGKLAGQVSMTAAQLNKVGGGLVEHNSTTLLPSCEDRQICCTGLQWRYSHWVRNSLHIIAGTGLGVGRSDKMPKLRLHARRSIQLIEPVELCQKNRSPYSF